MMSNAAMIAIKTAAPAAACPLFEHSIFDTSD